MNLVFIHINLQLLIFQLFLTCILFILADYFGSLSKGYVTMDQILSTSNLSYNLLFRIVAPSVFISFTTLILDKIGFSGLTKDIWIISMYYYLIIFIALVLMGRFGLVNKYLFSFIAIAGILISYWIYNFALRLGPSAILPDSTGFRTELWLIVIAFFYNLFNNYHVNFSHEYAIKTKFVLNRYKSLSQKYDKFLKGEFKNNKLLKLIFYSIMITEDINRPSLVRKIEGLLFFTKRVKTTGIMQINNNKKLTDEESVGEAQKIILLSYNRHYAQDKMESALVFEIGNDYNSGSYGQEIQSNFLILKQLPT